MNDIARDVTDAEFHSAVLDRSHRIPVVVDLWAPWCGPCRQLGPLLERLARERQGEFELVKLNVDENPVVAGQLGARSIPLVVAFRDGAPVSSFVGAQPLAAIKKFIDGVIPTRADLLVREAAEAREAGRPVDAERLLNEALAVDRQHRGARLDLTELLVAAARYKEALTTLQALPSKSGDAVSRLMAEIRTRMSAGVDDIAALEAKASADPADLDAAITFGQALAASRDYQRALDILLAAVRRDPGYRDGAARQAIIDMLAVMGPDDPLTREYRRELARAIH